MKQSGKYHFKISQASKTDNKALKEVILNNYMDADITVTFQREPDYFYSLGVEGYQYDIIKTEVCYENGPCDLVGFGSITYKKLWLNGKRSNIGYLSSLRLNREWRGSSLLSRGFSYFRKLHFQEQEKGNPRKTVPFYLTTIIKKNKSAIDLLTSGKALFPHYCYFGDYCTYAIPFLKKRTIKDTQIKIVKNSEIDIEQIIEYINRQGETKQFYPVLDEGLFKKNSEQLRDFSVNDFYCAIKDGNICGILAKWDQSGFKQNIVLGYKGFLKLIKPFYNLIAGIFSFAKLPDNGEEIKSFYISFTAIDNNDPVIFSRLLEEIYNDYYSSSYHYFLLGLHQKDPLNRSLKGLFNIPYVSCLYLVHWQGDPDPTESLDDRIPYLELATI